MSFMVPLALVAWIPVVLLIFAALPARRAVVVAFLVAWMFLPPDGLKIAGLPDYNKTTATCLGVLLATVLWDPDRLTSLRLRWFDLPMLVWCLCPFASSISNHLGEYDGVSSAFYQTVAWGLPYLIGRAHLRDLADLREMTVGLFYAGLVYAVFCMWESRMGPALRREIYGLSGGKVEYANEFGKWGTRPVVFMANALEVGTFMSAAALAGVWLWVSGVIRRVGDFPAWPFVFGLLGIALICKSLGALTLLGFGIIALLAIRYLKSSTVVYLMIIAAPLYIWVRATDRWSGEGLAEVAGKIHARRERSLEIRLFNENLLLQRALERPVFGWGGWGRNRVYDDETGKDLTLTDGLWILALGVNGFVGLVSVMLVLLVPAMRLAWHYRPKSWVQPELAGAAAPAVILCMYAMDCLFNAMVNPIYLLLAGGVANAAAGAIAKGVRSVTQDETQGIAASTWAGPAVGRA